MYRNRTSQIRIPGGFFLPLGGKLITLAGLAEEQKKDEDDDAPSSRT